eukprot:GHVR01111105.1.p1 GENE.GHVR01111105.1~~GHVR01111105.1.p1  ORF type:complete len:123 (-),score=15.65 GHVR01111105.1:557-925(-)
MCTCTNMRLQHTSHTHTHTHSTNMKLEHASILQHIYNYYPTLKTSHSHYFNLAPVFFLISMYVCMHVLIFIITYMHHSSRVNYLYPCQLPCHFVSFFLWLFRMFNYMYVIYIVLFLSKKIVN